MLPSQRVRACSGEESVGWVPVGICSGGLVAAVLMGFCWSVNLCWFRSVEWARFAASDCIRYLE